MLFCFYVTMGLGASLFFKDWFHTLMKRGSIVFCSLSTKSGRVLKSNRIFVKANDGFSKSSRVFKKASEWVFEIESSFWKSDWRVFEIQSWNKRESWNKRAFNIESWKMVRNLTEILWDRLCLVVLWFWTRQQGNSVRST